MDTRTATPCAWALAWASRRTSASLSAAASAANTLRTAATPGTAMAHSTALIASIATSSRSVDPRCRDTRHLPWPTSDSVEPGDEERAVAHAARLARTAREREGDDARSTVTLARRPAHNGAGSAGISSGTQAPDRRR